MPPTWESAMRYFAYGSNMCTGRLRKRVSTATFICRAKLSQQALRFHKRSKDKSAKADAFYTGRPKDVVWGVIFEFDGKEKPRLDEAEGLGQGYVEKNVTVIDDGTREHRIFTYVADEAYIDQDLLPYSWYTRFVIEGAKQHELPPDYIAKIEAVPADDDPDKKRDAENRAIAC
jgi:gamma-glutamylcyclotransferase